ncbi:pimeloyl-ACP methyl ester carboxylesterase [Nocardia transvalensis]|uniref:Pimeloyl-ACP methyl ester carboxylesterase n=1 Tax=Nocardia transvalensis TaxID=37333 RepID=A0A7W9PKA2_9NOCA|nr:alpha/beta hydrolase [Nocardia transvalensis]MBB5917078.1 pimeloyl-ACP methyl ester carboxylesterase [Nocardia transvalensis]
MANLVRYVVGVVAAALLLAVPGAGFGPDLARADWFSHQRLAWHDCEGGSPAGGECATVRVPLDYADPFGRTISVAISRVPAADPGRRRGVLLANPGGPGASGLDTVDLLGDVLSPDVRAQYDLIGMDPRGVGRSDGGRNCGWPVGEMVHSAGVGLSGFLHDTGEAAAMASGCVLGDPVLARQLTTRNTARDMDVVRTALGESALSYFGVSYGTYLGAVYTQMFPEHSDRMVFDSSIDPRRYWEGLVQDWGPADETALDDWAGWAATRDETYHFGTTAPDVRRTVEDLIAAAEREPIVLDDFRIDDHWLPFILHNLLNNFRSNEGLADVVREIADAAGHPPATAHGPRLQAVLESLRDGENSALAFIACGDAAAPADPRWYWDGIEAARPTQPVFGAMANNIQPCAFWPRPAEPATEVRNAVPALLVQATGDPRTPYAHGVGLHRDLTASRLATLRDVRIHMTFRPGLSSCVNDTINTYYGTGSLPATDIVCEADPPPQ